MTTRLRPVIVAADRKRQARVSSATAPTGERVAPSSLERAVQAVATGRAALTPFEPGDRTDEDVAAEFLARNRA